MKLEQVAAYISTLADVEEGARWGHRTWMVGGNGFAWQRPFSKADVARFGDAPVPQGDILAIMVEDLDAKDALLAIAPRGFFTIPHFNGYPAVLVELRLARAGDVRAALDAAHRAATAKPAPRARRPKGGARGNSRTG